MLISCLLNAGHVRHVSAARAVCKAGIGSGCDVEAVALAESADIKSLTSHRHYVRVGGQRRYGPPYTCGDCEPAKSTCSANCITPSVRTRPGYTATEATPSARNWVAIARASRSSAAFATP